MAHSTRTVPILVASVIAVALVGGAFVLSGPIPFIDRVTAESSEELLRAYAVKDADADGLTDWQESLYGTDPANPNSFRPDLLDGEAARQELLTPKSLATKQDVTKDLPGADPEPNSLTEQFSKKFLERYLLTRGSEPPTEEAMIRFVTDAVEELAQSSTEGDSYTVADVRIDPTQTLTTYVIEVERIFTAHDPNLPKTELEYLELAVEGGDMSGLDRIAEISDAYTAASKELMGVPVSAELRTSHLLIANSLRHMGTALAHISIMERDPILTLLGIGEYMRAADEYRAGFTAAADLFAKYGQTIAPGAPGYEFYETAQRAKTTPAL